jgi:uncharacterized protein YgfB (UPF0149 family)
MITLPGATTMKQPELPTFRELDQALSKTSLKLHASQAHGIIAGIICGNPNANTGWESLVTGGESSDETHAVLKSLHEASMKQLDEFLFEFELLMPPDSDDLPVRAEAMTLWCQGFLTGLKMVQVKMVNREPGEMTEAINDIIEIAKMNYEEVVASEEDEAAYVELVEYVRMAVILIYQDMREQDTSKRSVNASNHLH